MQRRETSSVLKEEVCEKVRKGQKKDSRDVKKREKKRNGERTRKLGKREEEEEGIPKHPERNAYPR